MVRRKCRLARSERRSAVIAALVKHNWSVATAAQITGESRTFVLRWKQRYLEKKTIQDKARSGRPTVLSKQIVDTAVVLTCEQQNIAAVRRILVEKHGLSDSTSPSTLYRALKTKVSRSRPQMQPLISRQTRTKRIAFAQQNGGTAVNWSNVMSIDSAYFYINGTTPSQKVYTPHGVQPVKTKVNKSDKVHAYGGISAHGKTNLHFVTGTTGLKKRYKGKKGLLDGVGAEEVQDVLGQKLLPEAQELFDKAGAGPVTFLMDNAPGHTAESTVKFMQDNGIKKLEGWPGNSPDLNPIENIWGITKPEVYRHTYNSMDELKAAVISAWEAVPLSTLRNCMLSMPRRLETVLKKNGGYTGY